MAPTRVHETTEAGWGTPNCLDPFHQLVSDLSRSLGPSSGLDSSDIDVLKLQKMMINYIPSESNWSKYAFSDLSRGYTRNLVDEGNGKSNLVNATSNVQEAKLIRKQLVLVWSPGKGSPIHDHADAHCLMKVLKGSLKETRYDFPEDGAPRIIKETVFKENEVTYMSDDLGLHRISNPDPEEVAVSLHLYTPPNAAREGCNIFDEKTGKRSHVTQSNFHSEFGKKVGS